MIRRPPRSTRTDTRFPYDALPISATLRDLADIAYGETERLPDGMDAGLEIQYRYRPPPITMTSAAHACIVEVDADTGFVRIKRWVTSEDCGNMINPAVVEGQIAGGQIGRAHV